MLWDIFVWIIIGGIGGLLADWALKGVRVPLLAKLGAGILGGLAMGWLWRLLGGGELDVSGKFIASLAGGTVILVILQVMIKMRIIHT